MEFSQLKENLLEKLEKEGHDKPLGPYLDMINSTNGCVTSSSCYGRILLLNKPSESKEKASFVDKWHRKVDEKEVLEALKQEKGFIWFKVDPLILHISCKDVETAKKVLKSKNKAGIKRGGVFHMAPERVQIEVEGTQKMESPVKKKDMLVGKDYIELLVNEANKKFERNEEQWNRFEKAWEEEFD